MLPKVELPQLPKVLLRFQEGFNHQCAREVGTSGKSHIWAIGTVLTLLALLLRRPNLSREWIRRSHRRPCKVPLPNVPIPPEVMATAKSLYTKAWLKTGGVGQISVKAIFRRAQKNTWLETTGSRKKKG